VTDAVVLYALRLSRFAHYGLELGLWYKTDVHMAGAGPAPGLRTLHRIGWLRIIRRAWGLSRIDPYHPCGEHL